MMFIFSLVSIIWKAYCIHAAISLSEISILLLHIFCIIAECFNQLIHNLVKVHRKLCTYRQQHATTYAFRKTIFTQNMYSKDSTLTYYPSSTTYLKELCTAASEHDFALMSNTCCTPLCKETAQKDITSWNDLVLCQECYILEKILHKAYIGGIEKKCQRPC